MDVVTKTTASDLLQTVISFIMVEDTVRCLIDIDERTDI